MTTSAAKKKFPDGTSPRLVYIVPLFETANFRTYLGIFKTHLNPKIGSKYGFKWVSLQDSTKDLYLVTTPFEWWTVGQSLVTQPQSNRVEVECRRPTRWPGERVKKKPAGLREKTFFKLASGYFTDFKCYLHTSGIIFKFMYFKPCALFNQSIIEH